MTHRTHLLTAAFVLVSPLWANAADVDFARDVRPLLQKHCVRCHGEKKQEGGLRLDVRRRALAGGDTGPAVVAGKGGELSKRVESQNEKTVMPPAGPLADAEVATLRAWVTQGAKWPDEFAGKEPAEEHWAFRPLRRPEVPTVSREPKASVPPNPIDAFVRAKLSDNRLSPAADKRTLIRRLHLDLIGLPPTPEEVDAFLKDTTPTAYEKVVDRLLASPHFGERWGRHWLDLARFAESDGYENDNLRPDAWRFRDWVDRRRSTPTCRSTSSRSSNWPATCCRTRPPSRRPRPGSTATRCGTAPRPATRRSSAPTPSRTAPTRPASCGWG